MAWEDDDEWRVGEGLLGSVHGLFRRSWHSHRYGKGKVVPVLN
jgi:hypothetical protein